ncbi:MAG: response regulator transcription factor [Alphaproteobacteria bacterium]
MKKTVLIIDDDDLLRSSLAKGLKSESFAVITAQSAETANEILKRMSVNAIVLDRMMAGVDGLTLLKGLRASGNQTPVIMLTALSGPENAIVGLSGGADDYLAKPFQLKELVLRLKNIMRQSESKLSRERNALPTGLAFSDNEFYINDKLLGLSMAEKELLKDLTFPVGNIVPATPMVAKRMREKLLSLLQNVELVTVRGKGYKLVIK